MNLRELRESNYWTLSRLANRADMSIGKLSQLERGIGPVGLSTVPKLARAFRRSRPFIQAVVDETFATANVEEVA